ncbi:glycosyltransferase family protein [Nonomuraea sp. CA-218870]|uniref:glycosyltransferase family protein n=1 Tax=Nonomuraea sp. CA-218870 TaxID=3239998 RepID=UPI003D92A189
MRIGYSFWGFLGTGITDTPDGGRSHRRPFIDAIQARGHQVVFLQPNRDLIEAGDHLADQYLFDADLPDIDVLFAEWRWPIPGRNTTACTAPGHTCDLHRQAELLDHYTHTRGLPTLVWDKDRRLPQKDPLRRHPSVMVCEAALTASPGTRSLLFPLDDALLDQADPVVLAARPRPFPLTYVGNQYDRDQAFEDYFAPAADRLPHRVAGKWYDTGRWPSVAFIGRVPFSQVSRLYGESLATVLLLPDRYAAVGQMTQRIFEAVLAGCLPLAPSTIAHVDQFVPSELIVHDGYEVIAAVQWLSSLAGTAEHTDLIAACLAKLDLFRLSRQLQMLETILGEFAPAAAGRRR